MNTTVIESLVPQIVKAEGAKSYSIQPRIFQLNSGDTKVITAYNKYYFILGEAPEGLKVTSDRGVCIPNSPLNKEQQHEHTNKITIENISTQRKTIEFMVLNLNS